MIGLVRAIGLLRYNRVESVIYQGGKQVPDKNIRCLYEDTALVCSDILP